MNEGYTQNTGLSRRQFLRNSIVGVGAMIASPNALEQAIYDIFQKQRRSEYLVSGTARDTYDDTLLDARFTVYKGRRIVDEFEAINGEFERKFRRGTYTIVVEADKHGTHRRKIEVNSDRYLPIYLKVDDENLLPTPFYKQVAQTNPPQANETIIVPDGTCRPIYKPTFYIDNRLLNPEALKYIIQLLEDNNSPVNQFTRRWFDDKGNMWFDGKGFSYAIGTAPPKPGTAGIIVIQGDSTVNGTHSEWIEDQIIKAAHVMLHPLLNPEVNDEIGNGIQTDADTILSEILQTMGVRNDSNGFVQGGLEIVVLSIFNAGDVEVPAFPGAFGYQTLDQRIGDFLGTRWPGNRYTSPEFPDDNLMIVS